MNRWLVGLLLVGCASAGFCEWVGVEPRVTDRKIWDMAFADKQHACAVGDSGLIMLTQDGGDSWTPEEHDSRVCFRSVSFCDARNGVIGGENGTVVRTVDGGVTWNTYLRRTDDPVLRVFLIDSLHVWAFAATNMSGVVLHSRDAGATWRSSTISAHSADLRDLYACDSTCAYMIVMTGKVFKTSDGGMNWVDLGGLPSKLGRWTDFIHVFGLNRDIVWVRRGPRELVRSFDGGATWTASLIIPDDYTQYIAAMTFVDAAHGWALSSSPTPWIYSTADSGATWECDSTSLNYVPEWQQTIELDSLGRLWTGGEFGSLYVDDDANGTIAEYQRPFTDPLSNLLGDPRCRRGHSFTIAGRRCDYSVPAQAAGTAAGYRIRWNGKQTAGVATTTGREHHVVR